MGEKKTDGQTDRQSISLCVTASESINTMLLLVNWGWTLLPLGPWFLSL